ncbi:hypothetical protein CYMTET_52920 [Cymbomonas tetramitiformis]|uniref:EGF-like domain-containing protein n=1 Tax=Cymbomonas tetramitiformis TaxID=36881 RepID=A0AAE0BIA4_9CHLO|nr:hypothetical protein CYMTET_52920 [Cymbomonas tetramitiformis]
MCNGHYNWRNSGKEIARSLVLIALFTAGCALPTSNEIGQDGGAASAFTATPLSAISRKLLAEVNTVGSDPTEVSEVTEEQEDEESDPEDAEVSAADESKDLSEFDQTAAVDVSVLNETAPPDLCEGRCRPRELCHYGTCVCPVALRGGNCKDPVLKNSCVGHIRGSWTRGAELRELANWTTCALVGSGIKPSMDDCV